MVASCLDSDGTSLLAGYDPVATAGDCWFDEDAASLAIEFFPKYLRHIKGRIAGQPFDLNPWERDFVSHLTGWKRPDGTRRYREAFCAVPRKNNKTTLCAGLALFLLLCDQEEGAEVYCAAGDRDQATLVFDPASKMVAKAPALARMCKVLDSTKRIIFPHRNSFMRAIPADAAGSHGFNAHVAIIDEVHTQPSRALYDVLKTSQASRANPLTIGISTAGHDRESICYELWDYARKVRDGEISDPHFLPCIYEAPEDSDWTDEQVWRDCNPNYGRSVSEQYLREAFERAKATPSFENAFRNLHLNQWTEAESRWISTDYWNACAGPVPDMTGQTCVAGLDLASTDDLTALVYVFPVDGRFYVKAHFWCPEQTVERIPKRYQRQYQAWAKAGLITRTPGNATDYAFVRQQIFEDSRKYNIREIGFDGWQALDTQQQLEQSGLPCTKISQTFGGLWPGVKAVEESVLARTLVHDGNDILGWMLASTVVDHDPNGNRKPNKRKSQGEYGTKGKIDGVVALCMAMSLAHGSDSPYDDRGVLQI